uniref:Ankyrin repeat domain-containing protein, chloroplastic n=1 Tax=Nelumbo nucifera TaxID=4432 RepID=A0A822ZKT1_NELNU|nr:TPA_asm: hypothetical protein HUJ06_016621 [Nelumbo nucifera]
MTPPNLSLKPQFPRVFFSIPNSPFSLSILDRLSVQTLTFSRNIPSRSLSAFSTSFSQSSQQQVEGDYEDELVVGDCVVFEEGIFEDPYLQNKFDEKKKPTAVAKPENLVPDKWKELQAEINITKKEKRKIAQKLEFGSRIEKKKAAAAHFKDMEENLAYRDAKLSQLSPVVLDNPTFPVKEEVGKEDKEVNQLGEAEFPSSSRVAPRNPRLAVYKGTLEDISEFFNSGKYNPGENSSKKSQGSRKLFTKEEKVLLNKRTPTLTDATSGKWLPLHTLAASGEFYLMDALLKHNVDINAADKDGLTALHRAIICKKQAIINYLLRESANPFVRDKDGWTPLHLAVQTQRTDLVRLLLIKGADKTLKNQDGLTPLDLCFYLGRDLRTYELIKLLKQLPKSQ